MFGKMGLKQLRPMLWKTLVPEHKYSGATLFPKYPNFRLKYCGVGSFNQKLEYFSTISCFGVSCSGASISIKSALDLYFSYFGKDRYSKHACTLQKCSAFFHWPWRLILKSLKSSQRNIELFCFINTTSSRSSWCVCSEWPSLPFTTTWGSARSCWNLWVNVSTLNCRVPTSDWLLGLFSIDGLSAIWGLTLEAGHSFTSV